MRNYKCTLSGLKKWLILKIYKDGKAGSPLILMSSYDAKGEGVSAMTLILA